MILRPSEAVPCAAKRRCDWLSCAMDVALAYKCVCVTCAVWRESLCRVYFEKKAGSYAEAGVKRITT